MTTPATSTLHDLNNALTIAADAVVQVGEQISDTKDEFQQLGMRLHTLEESQVRLASVWCRIMRLSNQLAFENREQEQQKRTATG